MSQKFTSINCTNKFYSKGSYSQPTGAFKLGTSIDSNYNNANVFAGSAYSQGQTVRSLFDLNDNGPVLYQPTTLDKLNITTSFSSIFMIYPNLLPYPYLYPLSDTWLLPINSKDFPIFRYSGKGLGKMEFYNAGSSYPGNISKGVPEYLSFYFSEYFVDDVSIKTPQILTENIWPYSGKLYSGHLVQYLNEQNNVKVIPYQTGRGIPQYDPTQKYFSGNAFGIPKWPNTDIPIPSQLSTGVVPGNNNVCFGVSIETESNTNKVYKYHSDYSQEYDDHVKFDNHPAAFTAPPENVSFTNNARILSPENSNQNYWAPWPFYYAYNPNDKVPIQAEGLTSVKIGAAFNIGAQAYYEPDVAPGDDPINNPNYVSVSTVPLFQGEVVKVGSTTYASCLGHIITPERVGLNPYPASVYSQLYGDVDPLTDFVSRRGYQENPWYDWFDVTYGAVGWTGTPQFLLTSIPDEEVAIIETRNGTDLPYLAQSNQGSIIVHPTTTIDSSSPEGSGRMTLIGPAEYNSTQINFARISKFPGTVERSLPVGPTMQQIEGTGRWTYTGVLEDNLQTVFINGFGYDDDAVEYTSLGGTGTGLVLTVTSVNALGKYPADPANIGSIGTINITNPGSGYTEGDIIQLVPILPTIDYAEQTLQFYGTKSATLKYTNGNFQLNPYGDELTQNYTEGYNITRNSMRLNVKISILEDDFIFIDGGAGTYVETINSSNNPGLNINDYPSGTEIYIYVEGANLNEMARYQVQLNNGVNISLQRIYAGSLGLYNFSDRDKFFSTLKVNSKNPLFRKEPNGPYRLIDPGFGNYDGDLILINGNVVVQLNMSDISNSCKLVTGGAGYHIQNSDQLNNPGGLYSGFDVNTNKVSQFFGTVRGVDTITGGTFGNILTIEQILPDPAPGLAQPIPGSPPPPIGGYQRYVIFKNATFLLEPNFNILNGGTGYSIGMNFSVSGGSGTGLTVDILKVSQSGSIEKLQLNNIGSGYVQDDVIEIVGGNNDSDILLTVPITKEMDTRLLFNPVIINAGTGYTVGGPFNVTCPNRPGTGMTVNVLNISGDGGITALEIITGGNNLYSLFDRIIIDGGNNDSLIELGQPIVSQKITFTKGGTSYTTANGVTTFNLTQNNLYTICGLETTGIGECQIFNYNVASNKPRFPMWDLSRYDVGDVLAFDQDGNDSATAEILTLGANNSITFNQLTTGVGYADGFSYGWLPTINLSKTPTTVDIIADDNGNVTNVSINTLGDDVKYNDYLIIQQGDNNAVVKLEGERDVPAPWQPFENDRSATADEWNQYKTVLKSSVNLLDNVTLIDFKKQYPNYFNNSWYFYGDPDNKDPYLPLYG